MRGFVVHGDTDEMPPRKLLAVIASLLVGIATLVAVPTEALAAPNFKAPFPCGQQWTYSHHSGEVRRALDFIRSDGGTTNGTPVLASGAMARRLSSWSSRTRVPAPRCRFT